MNSEEHSIIHCLQAAWRFWAKRYSKGAKELTEELTTGQLTLMESEDGI